MVHGEQLCVPGATEWVWNQNSSKPVTSLGLFPHL